MKKTTLIICALLTQAASPPETKLPAVIVIHPNDHFGGWTAESGKASARINLELGDTIESAMVEVVPRVDDDRDLALQYQIETSMTIMDEGPHIDLVDSPDVQLDFHTPRTVACPVHSVPVFSSAVGAFDDGM